MKIETKQQMYDMLKAGTFGNAFRTWPSVRDALLDDYFGPFGLRTSVKGGPVYPGDMSISKTLDIEKELREQYPDCFLAICEEVPNQYITMNFELQRNLFGLYLRYKEGPGHMRPAMADCRHASNIIAYRLLEKHIGVDGVDHMRYLLDNYEGINDSESAVIEAAAFSRYVGPERQNYVIWEVRSY